MYGPDGTMRKALLSTLLMFWAQFAAAQVTGTPQNWRDDLQTLTTSLPNLHPNLFFQTSRTAFQQAAANLDQQIPQLSDSQIIAKMAEILTPRRLSLS